ncbi:hypothetical protein FPOAC2_06229 [Fusarium poae]|uniref:hypothetical protein n=1 Tax=Fusarium poae TaxID=36050 RepID=UPI001CEA1B5C|nr:hypothetical protein FPOAC1_006113 [Fusarium poae]KAG8672821.1 hypothetical protein FPOAC1_006113 [Fusarium poae]
MFTFKNIAGLALLAQSVTVQSMDLDSTKGILEASKALAGDLIELYNGNNSSNVPGLLEEYHEPGDGYYWYQSGAFMSAFVDYWQLTGDDTYNDLVSEGIQWQVGRDKNFMPANQTRQEGNDDQAIWAMAAMTAAEYDFPAPSDKKAQWYNLARNAWDTQRKRWDAEEDSEVCYGGLRWQIMPTNVGFTYKQTLSTALFFNLGARIYRWTGSEEVADYVTMAYSWLDERGLIDSKTGAVYDGARVDDNCTTINKFQWSVNAASLSMGLAYLYNTTSREDDTWKRLTEEMVTTTLDTFFTKNGEFKEVSCTKDTCPRDILTYKALTHRWLAVTTKLAPFLSDKVLPVLVKSAKSLKAESNGKDALEQKLANFAVVSNLLIADSAGPMTQNETKTEDDSSDTTGSATTSAAPTSSDTAASATTTADEGNSAIGLAGSGGLLAISMLIVAFQGYL